VKRRWIQKAKLKKGGLHRALGFPLEHKFTAFELGVAEGAARASLERWNAEGDHERADRARHMLRMVLFAKNARKFKRPKKFGKRKKSYRSR
jgi:hypothetical protein